MILYHASTVQIDEFFVPHGGIHTGGRHSALEAALRKVRGDNANEDIKIYVHRLDVELGRSVLLDDMGNCDSWRRMIIDCDREGYNSIEYSNVYEPDVCNSYMIWEPSRIKVLSIEVLSQDAAEDIVNEFYETYNL